MIAILADTTTKSELIQKPGALSESILWADSLSSLMMLEADAYFDLQFDCDPERTTRLRRLLPKPVFISAVEITLKGSLTGFIRINAWPGMLERELLEIVLSNSAQEASVKAVFDEFGWKYLVSPDVPGMISSRVIAMMINEAYFTYGAGTSSRQDIDTAMKLGTNYPLGPFEWAEKIGIRNLGSLLKILNRENPNRYEIAPALLEEMESGRNNYY